MLSLINDSIPQSSSELWHVLVRMGKGQWEVEETAWILAFHW